MSKLFLTFQSVIAALCLTAAPKTDVMFCFDTEDYTNDHANDAIRDLANVLTEEGVTGHFFVVGYLAQRLVELGRQDVIDALKPHVIGSQTLYHSRHPDLCEYTDIEDAAEAHRRALVEEAQSVGALKAVFGMEHVDAFVPPGNCFSYAGMEACTDLGMRFYGAGAWWGYDAEGKPAGLTGMVPTRMPALGLWYFNMYQIPYLSDGNMFLEKLILARNPEPDYAKVLDHFADVGYCGFYMHPNQAVCKQFWDGINYRDGRTERPWRQWKVPEAQSAEYSAETYRRLRKLIRAIKADGRFRITNLREIAATIKPRRTMTPSDVPAIRAALCRDLGPIAAPGSYSVADAFQGAVRFLRGEREYVPGRVYGFLERPRATERPVELRAGDLRLAAAKLDLSTYLPPVIEVGGVAVGPADFLLAALELLETGEETVKVTPRKDQLGSFREIAALEKLRLVGPGSFDWVIHSPDFKDEYLSDRLRLQLWTMRYER